MIVHHSCSPFRRRRRALGSTPNECRACSVSRYVSKQAAMVRIKGRPRGRWEISPDRDARFDLDQTALGQGSHNADRLGRNAMKTWMKPEVREQEVGLEVTSYLPAEVDIF
jgi:coenzyme PQQ precursor peptide PqqA